MRRHRAAIASHAALAVALGAVAAYAISAEGYRTHQTELNDGGIWVVNGKDGYHGRINKPINQLDTAVFADDSDVPLDVLQQGAAVVGVNERAGIASTIDPAESRLMPGMQASLPRGGEAEMYGGTLASLDASSGKVWAVPVDSRLGEPDISRLDRQARPLDTAGAQAALAVTASGAVVVTSSEERTVRRMDAGPGGFATARTSPLPEEAGDPDQAAAVGEQVVTLDQAAGILHVLDGPTVDVPAGSVLQQAGPGAGAVLVATPAELLEVDLGSGDVSTVAEGVSGRPVEPVRLGACVYGAWSGGIGHVAVRCGDEGRAAPQPLRANASDLAFRVNRQQVVLNDAASGAVWDLDEEPVRIDNWEAFTSARLTDAKDKEDEEKSEGDRRPPKAEADTYGVRPGRTSVLHPLDNDSAPAGRLLSIVAVDQPDVTRSQVTISPDGQTLQLSVPEDLSRTTSFEYHIDDGRGLSASARITVDPREESQNEAPHLRQGHQDRTWRVAHDGTIAVPALASWRDDADSDTLALESVRVAGGPLETADARLTPDGRIRFSAGASRDGGRVPVSYTVSDGHGGLTEHQLAFDVQSYEEYTPYPPVAHPDVVRGEVGRTITVRPLLNDLPGADPNDPDAALSLGGELAPQAGLRIDTDLETGVISVNADRPGSYFLDYDAAYGNAPLDHAKIRVDVRPRPRSELDPVAMPDNVTLHGPNPVMVDVLANDLDPGGGLLAVQRATPESDQVDVAIVDNRWLRVSAADGTLDPDPQVVHYTISNGAVSGVEGQVTVRQEPEPEDTSPLTTVDQVVVRAGEAVTASVLDNDVSPTGSKLSLRTHLASGSSGELEVQPPKGLRTDAGRAFVSGRVVRFVAPAALEERTTIAVPYVASDDAGATATGELQVTVVPTDAGNEPPRPTQLDGRTHAGGVVTLRIPGSGIDPDGDAVTVTGVESAPMLGRITEFGANGLTYQAFPGSTGTDELRYTVTDSRGASASGVARIVVMPPGEPQRPLAVDDRVTVAPGRTVRVDAIANDFVGTGEGVEVSVDGGSAPATYDRGSELVEIRTPRDPEAPSSQVVYTVDNGLESSRATILVQTVEGFNNPPVLYDAYGVADDSEAVSVDVLEGAYDPDGPLEDLHVVDVFHPTASFTDSRVKVSRSDVPQVVPFRVEDADGGAAVASLYVPPAGSGVPYVKDGAFLEVDTNGTVRGKLADYVVNPSGGPMRLAARDGAFAAPEQASARVVDDQTFELSGSSDYVGPGALLLRVTTVAEAKTAGDDRSTVRDGVTTLVSIPAQIGRPKPVLTCPEAPFEVVQSDRITLDIPSLCNVFTADPAEAEDLAYQVEWSDQPAGLALSQPTPGRVVVAADGGARVGTEATLVVRAGDSDPAQVRVRVVRAPSPRLLPVKVPDIKPGESRTIDLAPYLQAGVPEPDPTLLSVERVGSGDAAARKSGDTEVTLRGGERGGLAAFRVVMSDVDDPDAGPERRAEGVLRFEVGAVPDAPIGVIPWPEDDATEMTVHFLEPDDNGSPIQRFVVQEVGTGKKHPCDGSGCLVDGLKLGKTYRFRVAAVNKFGQGPWSEQSRETSAGGRPSLPGQVKLVRRGSGTITVRWSPPQDNGGSDIDYYTGSIGGQEFKTADGTVMEATVDGLSNNRRHAVTVLAYNGVTKSKARTSPGWFPLGKPETPTGVAANALGDGSTDSTAVDVTWHAAAPNGPGPTRYVVRVSRNDGPAEQLCSTTELSCQDTVEYDGATYSYQVTAHNNPAYDNPGGNESPIASDPSAPASFVAIGRPAAWTSWSVTTPDPDDKVHLRATVPDSRGKETIVRVTVSPDGESTEMVRLSAGDEFSRELRTGTNYEVSTVTMQLCNEAKCGDPVSASAQSYGPIPDPQVTAVPPNKGDQVARWSVATNGNGRPVTLHYQVGSGTVLTQARGDSPTTGPISFDTQGYHRRAELRVWVTDAGGTGRRASDTRRADAYSGQPPDMAVNPTVGAACGGSTGVECNGADIFDVQCNGNTACNNVDVTVSGWWNDPDDPNDAVRCRVTRGGVRPFEATFAGNGTYPLGHYPRTGSTVVADCWNVDNNSGVEQAGRGTVAWPDDAGGGGNARLAAWGP